MRFAFVGPGAPPGASGRVRWRSAVPHLPADLLVRRDGRLGVFLVNDAAAHFHPLPGALAGQPARSDLGAEARVIVAGRQRLRDGQAVRVAAGPADGPP
jgi:hypothetical protein